MDMKLAMIGLIMILAVIGMQQVGIFSVFQGFNVLSIGQTQLMSSDPTGFLSGKVWQMFVTQNGAAQTAVGTISASSIRDASGATATKDLEISMSLDKAQCKYNIQKMGDVYRVDGESRKFILVAGANSFKSECQSRSNYVAFTDKLWPLSDVATCWVKTPLGFTGDIKDKQFYFESTGKVSIGGQVSSGTLNSASGVNNVRIGNVAQFAYSGNLASNVDCPTEANVKAIYLAFDNINKWTTGNPNNVASYTSSWQNIVNDINQLPNAYFLAEDAYIAKLVEWQNNRNMIAYGALSEKTWSDSATGRTLYANTQTLDSARGQIVFDNYFARFPAFTLYVKADTLGVKMPCAQPSIRTGSVTDIQTGDLNSGKAVLYIRNTGSELDSFTFGASCSNSAVSAGTSQTVQISGGQEQQYAIGLTGSTSADTSTTCTANVVSGCGLAASTQFQVGIKAQKVCMAGQRVCSADAYGVEECNSAGTGYANILSCQYGCEVKSNIATCKEKPAGCASDNDCVSPDPLKIGKCDAFTKTCKYEMKTGGGLPFSAPVIFAALLALLGAALAYVNLKEEGVVGLLIAAIVGTIIGLVTWWVFENWLVILLASALGGAAIYLIGGGAVISLLILLLRGR